MAESLLPFQCNHVDVEGLWKNTNTKKIQKLKREKVETDKRKRRRKRRKKKKKEEEEKQLQRMKRSPALPHLPPHCHSSSFPPPDWVKSACSFFFFFIQLYCKNWILFFVLFLDYLRRFLRVKQSQIGLFFPAVVFLFLLFFCVFICLGLDSKVTVRSGLITVLRTVWLNRGSNGFLFF